MMSVFRVGCLLLILVFQEGNSKIENSLNNKNAHQDAAIQPKNEYIESEDVEADKIQERESEEGDVDIGGGEYAFPVAKTTRGMYLGRVEQSRAGERILAFRGIKHVKPPVGDLRLKPPVLEKDSWEGVIEAKSNGQVCPQHLANKPDIWIGNEDCLWLNVFTRDLVRKKGRPVVVWIHGGSFSHGSAAEYEPSYLLDQDIVLVTIQYRLGFFGFLSTETSAAPGNYGMLDQIAALKWVKENIEAFSGDPDMVTIMGQQAGGASVHYLMLSPITKELFNRGISLSGTALSWWASLNNHKEMAQRLSANLGCSSKEEETAECLRSASLLDIMNSLPILYRWRHLQQTQEPITVWSPRVDIEADVDNGQLSFLPERPIELMEKGRFRHNSWLTGITDDEGATRASAMFAESEDVKELETNFDLLAPLLFGLTDSSSSLGSKIKEYYFGSEAISSSHMVDALSDSSFSYPMITSLRHHAQNGANVFLYHFSYKGKYSQSRLIPNMYPPSLYDPAEDYGVGNGDDLIYLFPVHFGIFQNMPEEDLKVSKKLIELLISFVKTC